MRLKTGLVQGLAMAVCALGASISPAASQSSGSHPQIDAQLLRIVKGEGPRAKILSKNVFFGDYDGDGRNDALGIVYYDEGEGGNSFSVKAAIFHGEPNGFRFVRLAKDIFGISPRNAVFGNGVIEITTMITGPNDPRCCPTLAKKYTIPTK